MSSRSEVETVVNKAFVARHLNDAKAVSPLFAEACSFRILASERLGPLFREIRGRASVVDMVAALSQAWDMTGMKITNAWIDGDTAIVRRAGTIRYVPRNTTFETVILDIVKVKDGKIIAVEEFVDTELMIHTMTAS